MLGKHKNVSEEVKFFGTLEDKFRNSVSVLGMGVGAAWFILGDLYDQTYAPEKSFWKQQRD